MIYFSEKIERNDMEKTENFGIDALTIDEAGYQPIKTERRRKGEDVWKDWEGKYVVRLSSIKTLKRGHNMNSLCKFRYSLSFFCLCCVSTKICFLCEANKRRKIDLILSLYKISSFVTFINFFYRVKKF